MYLNYSLFIPITLIINLIIPIPIMLNFILDLIILITLNFNIHVHSIIFPISIIFIFHLLILTLNDSPTDQNQITIIINIHFIIITNHFIIIATIIIIIIIHFTQFKYCFHLLYSHFSDFINFRFQYLTTLHLNLLKNLE